MLPGARENKENLAAERGSLVLKDNESRDEWLVPRCSPFLSCRLPSSFAEDLYLQTLHVLKPTIVAQF